MARAAPPDRKEAIMNTSKSLSLALLCAGALVTMPAVAADSAAPAPMPCAGAGPCGGAGPGAGGMPGFALMTPEERAEHMAKLHGTKSMAECEAYVTQHRAAMVKRAQEQGKPLPAMRHNPCEMMKQQGAFK
jgi:hypothetical protein